MIAIRPTPRAEVESRWEAARARARAADRRGPTPRPRNVRAVLDLGEMTYFHFRGRAYGVPPLPWKEGEALLDVYLQMQHLGEEVTRENLKPYYGCLKRISDIVWKNTQVYGRLRWLRRLLKRLHLTRNPFRRANDAELAEVAVFYLGHRTRRTKTFRPGPVSQQS